MGGQCGELAWRRQPRQADGGARGRQDEPGRATQRTSMVEAAAAADGGSHGGWAEFERIRGAVEAALWNESEQADEAVEAAVAGGARDGREQAAQARSAMDRSERHGWGELSERPDGRPDCIIIDTILCKLNFQSCTFMMTVHVETRLCKLNFQSWHIYDDCPC